MGEDKLIDQSQLAESVASKIPYEFEKQFLVKPLDPVLVKKEFSKPIPNSDKATKDNNGIEAIEYDDVETEVKDVESDYRKGVVLKIPYRYKLAMADKSYPSMTISIGDVILFKDSAATWFDLVKDTKLIDQYQIVAIERNGDN